MNRQNRGQTDLSPNRGTQQFVELVGLWTDSSVPGFALRRMNGHCHTD